EFCSPFGARSQRDDRLYLWTMYADPGGLRGSSGAVSLVGEACVDRTVERDAVPRQLAVRFDEVPKAGARLGVGGPRLHSAARASGREDRCSNNAELCHGSPPASTWTILTWKMTITRHIINLREKFRS